MSFQPYTYKATVIKVYDGDTFTINLDLGFYIAYNEQVIRLARVNTPEIRGEERKEGLKVRDIVRSLILDKEVTIKTIKDKKEKYGRYLAEIEFNDENGKLINLSDYLIENGLGKLYLV
jgi:micrococcal nuclease